jgi:hypothetical protein
MTMLNMRRTEYANCYSRKYTYYYVEKRDAPGFI